MTRRSVFWVPWQGPGLEHLRLDVGAEEIAADGVVLGLRDGMPFRVRYRIGCDPAWRVRRLRVAPLDDGGAPEIVLDADGEGRWTDSSGAAVPVLDGCIDVDISATPFTNTLAIRRLGLTPGETAELTPVYIAVPALTVEPVPQRYTCHACGADGGRYLYEGLFRGFSAELPVDADGLVLDYPGTFRRIAP